MARDAAQTQDRLAGSWSISHERAVVVLGKDVEIFLLKRAECVHA